MFVFHGFRKAGRASFVLGGQWGSEGKGAAAASIAVQLAKRGERFTVITTNAGAQAGHTSTHDGKTRVVFHLPTAAIIATELNLDPTYVYLNAGSIIDVAVLMEELKQCPQIASRLVIHPNAAIITDDCKEAEGRSSSMQTRIASTRKGVGEALSRKVLRSGMLARDCAPLASYIGALDLNKDMDGGGSVLVEVPQGISLSVNGDFYPYCTSRDCTVMQAMSDASIHPSYYHTSMLVLRTYPIRVGNITENNVEIGRSGGCYDDQVETSWSVIGQPAEITTVTKRVRRVFTFSAKQARKAMALTRPSVVYLTFCDYMKDPAMLQNIVDHVQMSAAQLRMPTPEIVFQYGPTTLDLHTSPI